MSNHRNDKRTVSRLNRPNGTSYRVAKMRRKHLDAQRHGVAHHRRGIARRFVQYRSAGAGAITSLLAVLGPGMLAGLSDDDPSGITTYSLLGTDHGYRLLWIIPASTILLVYFHLLAVRVGAASGKGFVAIIRQRWGMRMGYFAVIGLLLANFGTICAEYAGISAAASLVGIPSWISTPIAGLLISLVVVLGSFHRVEVILLVISSTLALYIVDGIGAPASLDLDSHHFQYFYAAFVGLTVAAVSVVSLPGLSLIPLIYTSQVVNAILLPFHLVALQLLVSDSKVVGNAKIGSVATILGWLGIALTIACVIALFVSWISDLVR